MKSRIKFLLIICMCFLSTSCTAKKDTTALPSDLGVPDGSLNNDLRVIVPAHWNTLKKEKDFISMEIVLATDKQIVARSDFNAQIYLYDDSAKEWERIQNLANYDTPPEEIILRQDDVQGLTVLLDLSQASASQNNLLILVSGNVMENGVKTDQVVGTYVILKIKS